MRFALATLATIFFAGLVLFQAPLITAQPAKQGNGNVMQRDLRAGPLALNSLVKNDVAPEWQRGHADNGVPFSVLKAKDELKTKDELALSATFGAVERNPVDDKEKRGNGQNTLEERVNDLNQPAQQPRANTPLEERFDDLDQPAQQPRDTTPLVITAEVAAKRAERAQKVGAVKRNILSLHARGILGPNELVSSFYRRGEEQQQTKALRRGD